MQPDAELGRHNTQRERDALTEADQLAGGLRLRSHPVRPDQGYQQAGGGLIVQRTNVDLVDAVKADDLLITRHQHRATASARQERADLVRVAGVVDHDEDAAPSEQAPVHRRSSVQVVPGGIPSDRSSCSRRDAVLCSMSTPSCRKNWPSGKSWLSRCAARTASAVFPMPLRPVSTTTGTVSEKPSASLAMTSLISARISARPVNSATVLGSWCGVSLAPTLPGTLAWCWKTGRSILALRVSMACSRRHSSAPGSRPSSSCRITRPARKVSSASACRPAR